MLLRLLLAAFGSGHVDMASNQVKLLRPRMGREIGQEQLNAERERENVRGSSRRTQLGREISLLQCISSSTWCCDLYYVRFIGFLWTEDNAGLT